MSSRPIDLGRPPAELAGVRIVQADDGGAPEQAAEQVLERLLQRARAEGYAGGVAAAQGAAARALERAAGELDAYREEARTAVARTAVELAVEIARHLTAVEVEAGQHDIDRIVRETLKESGVGRGACVVHLHPEDARALEGEEFRSGTRLQPDIGVKRGEVQIETPSGLFVRDLDDAIQAIGQRILESLR